MASYVSTLNSSVPANWIAALHHDASAPQRTPRRSVAWRSSSPAAKVKKSEPDEEDHRVGADADELDDAGERADEEAGRADGEARRDRAVPAGERGRTGGSQQGVADHLERRYGARGGPRIPRNG